ncbi:MAG: hypothetical protein H6R04_402 [Burkholderiaceae bacterium]|nr:hypothetical protein [Burkholderiaceae bacterium]
MYPGQNSNTFMVHIGREVPSLLLDLPANAIDKDFRPLTAPGGIASRCAAFPRHCLQVAAAQRQQLAA